MEGSAHYIVENDSRTISLTYKSFEQQQKNKDLLFHHRTYIDRASVDSEDGINSNETTKLIAGKVEKKPRVASTGRKVCIMIACLYLQFTASGLISALGVIYVDLIRVFEAPHSEAALVQSLFMGMTVGGGIVFSAVIQKYGTGFPVIIASCISALAFIASYFAPNVQTLIATIGIISGGTMSINFLSPYVTIGWSFQENRKTVLAILTFGSTIGQMLFPYISQALVDNFCWNGSLLILSGFILNCIPCGLFLHNCIPFFHKGTSKSTKFLHSVKTCVTDYLFLMYLGIVWLFLGLGPVEMWFIVDLTILKGLDRTIGTTLLSLLGVFGFIGRLFGALFLRVFKRIDALVHFSYGFVIWGIGHYLVQYFDDLWGLILAVLVRGLSAGLTVAVLPGTMLEMQGIEQYAQTVALCNFMGGTAQILGGLLGGVTVDITGGYEFIFILAALVFLACGILTILIWFLKRRQGQRDSEVTNNHKPTVEEIQAEREPLLTKNDATKHD